MNDVIVENISKQYAGIRALDGISFEVKPGELFGFIGPDGAGKTSLFRIMVSLMVPDSGKATVCGYDVVKDYRNIRRIAGYMPGNFSLYQDLTVEENLQFFATIFGTTIRENYDLVKDIYSQIEPFKDRRAGALSGGMKQKLALSCAMIHKPEILFLDEPTTGVDAVSRREFWEMLHRLKEAGITIIVSTPYMDEASLCDRIALMQTGRLLDIGTPAAITQAFEKTVFAIRATNMHQLLNDLEKLPTCSITYPFGQYLHFIPTDNSLRPEELKASIRDMHPDAEVHVARPDIEDCFIHLMNKK